MSGDTLIPQQQNYLTTLGHAFLIGTAIAKGSTPEEIYDVLKSSWHDYWYSVGTMAGMTREETIAAVHALVEDGYILLSREGTSVYMLSRGAEWYVNHVWGIPWAASFDLTHPLQLMRGDRLLGTFELLYVDQPLSICQFTPAPAFEEVRGIFEDERQLVQNPGNEDATRNARKRIRMLGLRLVAENAEERRLFALTIDGERATLRLGKFTG